jgi:diguanylate cyclase
VSNLAEQEDWRKKYFDSIRNVEADERQFRSQLRIMYKLVGRLCLAAQGQSPRLDQELMRLKDAVRNQAPHEHLEKLGQSITDAVHQMDHGQTTVTAASKDVVAAAAAAAGAVAQPSTTRELPGEAILGDERLRGVLSRLLSELRRDPPLAGVADAIDRELSQSLTREQIPAVVERVGGLALQRIRGLEKARTELEMLLGQMMGQLDSLTRLIAGQNEDETERSVSSDTLNLQITGEVRALGVSVDSDTDLTALRRQLRERLNAISHHLHEFRAREEDRARQSRERAERMRARMDEMEGEARKLQARLTDEKRLSMLDPLTQIPNRLAYEQRVTDELERWKRFGQETCVAAWDIDEFKNINDSYGHRAGDRVLAVVAEALAKSIRATDFIARYGGEEFVLLLPGTTVAEAVRLANQMREAIGQIGFHFRGTPVSVTISCGVTAMREADTPEEVFDRADKAMYKAKDAGRNRVVSG